MSLVRNLVFCPMGDSEHRHRYRSIALSSQRATNALTSMSPTCPGTILIGLAPGQFREQRGRKPSPSSAFRAGVALQHRQISRAECPGQRGDRQQLPDGVLDPPLCSAATRVSRSVARTRRSNAVCSASGSRSG